ncbi:hypothetical protein BX285_7332 [Streptomyces sp. 1114.5]|uniref:hypothetical protein n=1 Tax=Streptomyces sp. 1114.5 TaxID=1938830 RepID=UPI000F29F770|nr:hypothetical protein [Streptomyces sp. 1114.5]RKT08960.1 hypothetical protein BX285_7332 [Streptomyces sp. 1114.5]
MAERARGEQRTSTVVGPVVRARPGPGGRGAAILCALLGLLPVTPVLAWSYGLAPFAVWFWSATVPSLALLAALGVATARRPHRRRLHRALVVGAVGGLLGTLGYDLFRVPFALAGVRLFAPIDTYGVLALGADSSDPRTGLLGWAFHFSNGIGFGISYAVLASGRRWQWALAWGLMIETLVVASPVAGVYALRGPGLIAIAYAGHLAYGTPLGLLAADPERTVGRLREVGPHTTAYALLAVLLVLVVWQRPFGTPATVRAGQRVAPGPSALVLDGRFHPQYLRIPAHGCVDLHNGDPVPYTLPAAVGSPRLEPGRTTTACFAAAGNAVLRVRTSDRPYAGGFVIVDRTAVADRQADANRTAAVDRAALADRTVSRSGPEGAPR